MFPALGPRSFPAIAAGGMENQPWLAGCLNGGSDNRPPFPARDASEIVPPDHRRRWAPGRTHDCFASSELPKMARSSRPQPLCLPAFPCPPSAPLRRGRGSERRPRSLGPLRLADHAAHLGDPAGADLLLALSHRTTRQSVTTWRKTPRAENGTPSSSFPSNRRSFQQRPCSRFSMKL